MSTLVGKGADLSDDGVYRYSLWRVWEHGKPLLVTIMVNPSTADHEVDDPTIKDLTKRAKLWGFGGLYVVNLFAYRTSSPAILFEAKKTMNVVGSQNEATLHHALEYAIKNKVWVLAAWGNPGGDHAHWTVQKAKSMGVELRCMGKTMHGHPKHPMARGVHRIPADFSTIPY